MSWSAYVDNLISSGNVDKGAIIGQNGGTWAASPGYAVSAAELKEISDAVNDTSTPKKVFGVGFHCNGEKFMTIKAEGNSLYGKKGKEGVIITKTAQAYLIGHHNEDMQSTNAANTVETIGDYLRKSGF